MKSFDAFLEEKRNEIKEGVWDSVKNAASGAWQGMQSGWNKPQPNQYNQGRARINGGKPENVYFDPNNNNKPVPIAKAAPANANANNAGGKPIPYDYKQAIKTATAAITTLAKQKPESAKMLRQMLQQIQIIGNTPNRAANNTSATTVDPMIAKISQWQADQEPQPMVSHTVHNGNLFGESILTRRTYKSFKK